jgi:predicted phosphodiesterase
MAIYGILGDMHGNKEALVAILQLLEKRRVEKIICVGDIVGYNADSEECISIMQKRGIPSIAGNHDLIAIRKLGFEKCSENAEYALRRTRSVLSQAAAEYLASLPSMMMPERNCVLIHGSVLDVQEYMLTPQQIQENSVLLDSEHPEWKVCFFGHTHEQRVYQIHRGSVIPIPASGIVALARDRRYFINAGSVDASRKNGTRPAECAIWNSSESTIEFCRVQYDHSKSEHKARAQGYRINTATAFFNSFGRRVRRKIRKVLDLK